MFEFVTAISLGLLGSFHCIGMCGPIALALPVHQFGPIKKFFAILFYNFGRAITYALFGLLFGLLGQGFFMGGFQQILSVGLGVLLLISVLYSFLFSKGLFQFNALNGFVLRLKSHFSNLFRLRGLHANFFIGLLNGLLPCGLVYVAIAGAIASGDLWKGTTIMFVFGLGTLPIMLSLSLFGQFMQVKYRNKIRKSIPIVISLMAVLMILRGLNLGIPYMSPRIVETEIQNNDSKNESSGKIMECCTKESD